MTQIVGCVAASSTYLCAPRSSLPTCPKKLLAELAPGSARMGPLPGAPGWGLSFASQNTTTRVMRWPPASCSGGMPAKQ